MCSPIICLSILTSQCVVSCQISYTVTDFSCLILLIFKGRTLQFLNLIVDLFIFIFNFHWLLLYLFWNYVIIWTNIWDCYVPWGIDSFVIIKYNSLSLIIPFALKPGFDFLYCFSIFNIIDFCSNFYYSYPCLALICSYFSIYFFLNEKHRLLTYCYFLFSNINISCYKFFSKITLIVLHNFDIFSFSVTSKYTFFSFETYSVTHGFLINMLFNFLIIQDLLQHISLLLISTLFLFNF